MLAKAQKWLDGNYDAETKKQVKYLMDNDMKELVESFYKDLEFGTGGLRGVMGVGTNRMNIYTVGAATQGLSNYLKRNFAGEEIRVVVGHDSRNNSRMFAERVADIFASNGFTVFLFDALRPTPELSFAIRELKCQSGVVVTASHNPKEYNGYKAYWSDGSQVTAPHDKNIIDEVEKITEVDQVLTGRNPQNIHALGKDFDELYLNKIYELSLSSESVKRFHDMKIVYSPMHGAGVRLVPESLTRFGFTNVQMVPEQAVIDGNFPTVESPNPEERKTMSMAIDLAKKVKADLVLATDPDSDRIGVALPDENGEYVGFDLDLAAEVCKRNDWELVKQPIDWNAKDMELNSGTISCIWNGFTMNGREDEYAWTDPYVDNSQVFVVKADSGIATFADLAGKSVAVQTDSSAEAALKEDDNKELKDSFKELVVVSDYNTAFMNLDSNAVEAIAMDIGVAKYQMESRDGEYKILDDVLSAEQYAVGFAKNNTELRDKVQKTLDEMRKDGKFAEIAEKWDLTDSVID